MRGELDKARKNEGKVYIEVSNAAGEFTYSVKEEVGENFQEYPDKVGNTLLTLINKWHTSPVKKIKFEINLLESSFLIVNSTGKCNR